MSPVLYGELIWSVSIDYGDFFVYEPATQDFLEFARSKGIDAAMDKEVDFKTIRRLTFVYQKELRKKLRQEYPGLTSITTVFGEAEWIRIPSERTEKRSWAYNLLQSFLTRLKKRKHYDH